MTSPQGTLPRPDLARATLGVLFIVALIALTVWILRPFLGAMIWAAMIVVTTWPVMRKVQAWLWGKRALAVATMTAMWLLLLALPLSLATATIVSSAGQIAQWAGQVQMFTMPPPPPWLGTLSVVGRPALEAWDKIATSPVVDLASTAAPYAAVAAVWFASALTQFGALLLQFLLTIAIAAVMYAKGEGAADGLLRFGRHIAGEAGDRVVRLAAQAIRGVALGVVVTALIQAALAGAGLALAGVPFAALLAVVAFVMCIAQLGPMLVLAPGVVWLYWQGAGGTATGLLVWTLVVGMLDNILRPILMTSEDLPLLLMFAGVIGGLLAFGLIGIFVGPVVLGVSYTLLAAWMSDPPDPL